MALTGDQIEAISRGAVDLYRAAESAILDEVTRRLAAGQDAPDWAVTRLGAISSLRTAVERILGLVEADSDGRVRELVARAYRTGQGIATRDLLGQLMPRDPDAAGAVRAAGTVPRIAVVENLAAALVADIDAKYSAVLRRVLDVYRLTIAQATGVSVAGGMTRRQAAQWAYARFVDQGVVSFTDVAERRWRLSSYVEMAVRTVTQRAAVQGQTDRLTSLGVDTVIVSDSPRECSLCLVPGTVVEGPAPTWRSRLEYTGDVISIATAGGKHLAGTPNHPVLTPRGWVRLDQIRPGDQVISHNGQQRYPGVMPDDVQVPALIEVAGESRAPLLLAGPTRRHFDSDRAYREVRAVVPDGYLLPEFDAALGEPLSNLLFVLGIGAGSPFLGLDDVLPVFGGQGYAPGGRMGGVEHLGSLFGGGLLPPLQHAAAGQLGSLLVGQPGHVVDDGLMARAGLHTGAAQVVADHPTADAEGGAELLRALAGQVTADEVVSVGWRQFRGHVWDLSTEPAWFLANGIVTHNCRPWEGKVLSISGNLRGRVQLPSMVGEGTVTVDIAGTVDEARGAGLQHPNCTHSLRAYLPGATRRPPRPTPNAKGYEAKERQREIERQIRKWKERESAALTPEARAGAGAKVRQWQAAMRSHLAANPELKRLPYRESPGAGNLPRP